MSDSTQVPVSASTTSDAAPAATSGSSLISLASASEVYYDVAKIDASVHVLLFFPVLVLWIMQMKRRGRNWSAWFLLLAYTMFQIIGSFLQVHKGKESISIPAYIFMTAGFTPLVMAVKSAINQCARETSLGDRFAFKRIGSALYGFLGVATILFFVLGDIGILKTGTTDAQKSRGVKLIKAGTVVLCLMYLINTITTIIVMIKWSVLISTRKLILVCLLSMPIIAVRIVSIVISTFKPTNAFFSATTGKLGMHIGFQIAPSAVVVILLVLAGFAQLSDLTRFESEKNISEYN